MGRQIVYLMSHSPHTPYLLCSLLTLRQHWQGPVTIYAWPESIKIVERICRDERLGGVTCELREPEYKGKNGQFLDKISLMQTLDYQVSLYLDADTLIHGPLDLPFRLADKVGFCCTQFNNWVSTGGIVRKRVERLREFPNIDQRLVETVLTNPWPSVNGGVFACRPTSPVLALWEKWTVEAISVFIADESVLHLMLPKFHPNDLDILLGGRYNCSPMRFQPKDLPDEEVIVRHFHGDSNVRRNKSEKGFSLWWPVWQQCLRENIGGVQEWRGDVGNKYLDKTERQIMMCG